MINGSTNISLGGKYKLTIGKAGQSPRIETPWFDNLITNQGLDHIGSPPVYNTSSGWPYLNTHCTVGTGTTTPAFTDTQLEATLAFHPSTAGSNIEGGTVSYIAGPPAYYRCIWTYTFATGAAAGNITEVGVGGMLNGDVAVRLFSRALIVDGAGNPTTITVLADEILTVTYELRMYLDTTDNAYSFIVNGITYSGTVRRAEIATAPQMYLANYQFNNNAYMIVYNGAIGPITGSPTGSGAGGVGGQTTTSAAYVTGSHYTDFTSAFDFTQGNVTGQISAIKIISNHGAFQFSVSPVLPKDSTHKMNLNWRYSWSRYP